MMTVACKDVAAKMGMESDCDYVCKGETMEELKADCNKHMSADHADLMAKMTPESEKAMNDAMMAVMKQS